MGNAFENQNGVAVVQTSKVKLGCHYGHDFWHVPVLLRTRIFWVVSYLGPHQPFSKQCLMADGSCKLITSRSSLVTLKFLDNKIASDQMLAEKRRRVVTISSCYVYVNTTSEVKTYLDTIRKFITWWQVSPVAPGSGWFSGLLFWIPQWVRPVYQGAFKFGFSLLFQLITGYLIIKCTVSCCTKGARPGSQKYFLLSMQRFHFQLSQDYAPISAGNSQNGHHSLPSKIGQKVKTGVGIEAVSP